MAEYKKTYSKKPYGKKESQKDESTEVRTARSADLGKYGDTESRNHGSTESTAWGIMD